MDARKKIKVLLLGYHGCLVTEFSDDKHLFSKKIIHLAKSEKYNGFIGITDYCYQNAIFNYQHFQQRHWELLESKRHKGSATDVLKNAHTHQLARTDQSGAADFHVHSIVENFQSVTGLKHFATSTLDDANGLPDPLLKCGSGFIHILAPLEKHFKDHGEILDESELAQEPVKKPNSKSKASQLLDAIYWVAATYPDAIISLDYVDTYHFSQQILHFPTEKIPPNVTLHVLCHDNTTKLSTEINAMAVMTQEGVRRLIDKPSQAEYALLPSSSIFYYDPREARANLRIEVPVEEKESKNIFCCCISRR